MKQIIVAIDGYSSCGKSTIAKQLAQYAGYRYIDTGAMYRAVALQAIRKQLLEPKSNDALEGGNKGALADHIGVILDNTHIDFVVQSDGTQHVTLNGEDVEKQIRTLEVGNAASQIAVIPEVRRFLVAQQQQMGKNGGIVMDGRDIGTVVFPEAELKLFLTASSEVRAERRFKELEEKGEHPVMADVLADVNDRDYRDTHRDESPLRQADDAIVVDNSHMTREEQMTHIYHIFDEKCK